jgi:anti-sigma regulatory factor (Ser/Thr protein kinase)
MKKNFKVNEILATDVKKIVPFATRIANEVLNLTGSQEAAFNVKLALEEALTNAMRHGNALNPALEVSVAIQADEESIALQVHDQGKGFDYERLPDPTAAEFVDRPCGRGVFLMRKLMDSIEYYDGGCGIKMIKCFSKKI